ncbi:MAG: hypothetical protein SAK29_39895 [Scytonema sp. PMC 1069.18]|nr:hypothetical protein [Scytonema sp. PMC 1069.18]MEC4885182.1 hypothetical protein [Scytonema sp. PMC 1070.18]
MKEFNHIFVPVVTIGLIALASRVNQRVTDAPSNIKAPDVTWSHMTAFKSAARQVVEQPLDKKQRNLRLSVTVDDPSFLFVKEGQQLKEGDTISDNKPERDRLVKQRSSILLQIDNLKSQKITQPTPPKEPLPVQPIPKADYVEELAAISQAQMKLDQVRSLLNARTPLLKSDNPERRAETEKAEANLQIATQKVEEQRQMIQAMQDIKMQKEIIQHESAKLRQLESELSGAQSGLDQERAKLDASAIEQQQQLQQLELAVQFAHSELELANSRLLAAKSQRQLVEYNASVAAEERFSRRQQLQQQYERQQQTYLQNLRDRDYQLAQLNISLSVIDDKLSLIPIVKSPRNGWVKRVKPWVGNNGKYTTVLTISSTNSHINSKNGDRANKSVSSNSLSTTITNQSTIPSSTADTDDE